MANRNGRDAQWMPLDAAAEYCGLTLSAYVALSRQGILPTPFQPGLTLIDRRALDRALDRLGCALETEPVPPIAVALLAEGEDRQESSDGTSAPDLRPAMSPERRSVLILGVAGLLVLAALGLW